MKTVWDYTALAAAYAKHPAYADEALRELFTCTGVQPEDRACDVGAGTGHLTVLLLRYGLRVVAVEPNDVMRHIGKDRTMHNSNATWIEGTGEDTGQPSAAFRLVTFGSSFNVVDKQRALQEAHRILRIGGWFACMWNHRDLEDPIQKDIEAIIHRHIPMYGYGDRRQDQTECIQQSGLFANIQMIEKRTVREQTHDDCIEAWRSHGTLHRQAGEQFLTIINEIATYVRSQTHPLKIPYITRMWIAQKI